MVERQGWPLVISHLLWVNNMISFLVYHVTMATAFGNFGKVDTFISFLIPLSIQSSIPHSCSRSCLGVQLVFMLSCES